MAPLWPWLQDSSPLPCRLMVEEALGECILLMIEFLCFGGELTLLAVEIRVFFAKEDPSQAPGRTHRHGGTQAYIWPRV